MDYDYNQMNFCDQMTVYHKPFNVQQDTFQNCARSKYETFNSIYDIYLRVTVTVIFE